MTGKEKCKKLKIIRKNLADELGIDLKQTECTFQGECKGTCPKCKSEENILNNALLKKGAIVLSATVLSASLAACTPQGELMGITEPNPPVVEKPTPDDLSGEVAPIEEPPTIEEPAPTDLDGDIAYAGEV